MNKTTPKSNPYFPAKSLALSVLLLLLGTIIIVSGVVAGEVTHILEGLLVVLIASYEVGSIYYAHDKYKKAFTTAQHLCSSEVFTTRLDSESLLRLDTISMGYKLPPDMENVALDVGKKSS